MIHVILNRELHLHEESTSCKCCPSVRIEDEIIVVHNELQPLKESDYITDEDESLLTDKPKNN